MKSFHFARAIQAALISIAMTGSDRPLVAQSGRWVVRLRFRLIALAGPSSNFPMIDWSESSGLSTRYKAPCARCVHREIKENPMTATASKLN